MIKITSNITLDPAELKLAFIASPGPGGQNVNKVATAVQLRFDVLNTQSLPAPVRDRLILLLGSKLTKEGELIIKASRFRTQERNKQDAIERLCEWILRVATPPKKRRKTKPTYASKQKRMDSKTMQGKKKALRSGRAD